jgi:hypothetical protein
LANIVDPTGSKVAYGIATAPGTKLLGKPNQSKKTIVGDHMKEINTETVHKFKTKDGNISLLKESLLVATPEMNAKSFKENSGDRTKQMQGVNDNNFLRLKNHMKKLLDDVGIGSNESVTFNIFNRSAGESNPQINIALKSIIKLVNSLDSRINAVQKLGTKDTFTSILGAGGTIYDLLK